VGVAAWLKELGLEQYAPAFRDNAIDDEVLVSLTGDDLKEIGIVALGHRKRLLGAIALLNRSGNSAAPVSGNQKPELASKLVPSPRGVLGRTATSHGHVLRPRRLDCVSRVP
jgi:hypothetical protein